MNILNQISNFFQNGIYENKLSDKWYNLGIQNIIIGLLIGFSSYLSIKNLTTDFSGILALSLIVIAVSFFLFLLFRMFVSKKHFSYMDNNKTLPFTNRIWSSFSFLILLILLIFNPELALLDKISNGLVNIDYSLDRKYIITIESLSLIALFMFFVQCKKIQNEKSELFSTNSKFSVALYSISALLVAKSAYGLLGGTYSSAFFFVFLITFSLLIQKSLVLFINNPILKSQMNKKTNFSVFDFLFLLSVPSIFSLLSVPFALWISIPIFFAFCLWALAYKNVLYNIVSFVLAVFAVLLGLLFGLNIIVETITTYAQGDMNAYIYTLVLATVFVPLGYIIQEKPRNSMGLLSIPLIWFGTGVAFLYNAFI